MDPMMLTHDALLDDSLDIQRRRRRTSTRSTPESTSGRVAFPLERPPAGRKMFGTDGAVVVAFALVRLVTVAQEQRGDRRFGRSATTPARRSIPSRRGSPYRSAGEAGPFRRASRAGCGTT